MSIKSDKWIRRMAEQTDSRHQAVVIPSPARREIPELANAWVMKEVPVKKAAN